MKLVKRRGSKEEKEQKDNRKEGKRKIRDSHNMRSRRSADFFLMVESGLSI